MPSESAPSATDSDIHGGPGWLAASGMACLIGQHWPIAALSPLGASHYRSKCADCGKPMERIADGAWRLARQPGWRGAAAVGSR